MTEPTNNHSKHKQVNWSQIITGVVGAVIVGMQGVNISETNSQTHLIQRLDRALAQQSELIVEVNQEGKRIDKALENQQQMIVSMEALLHNQDMTLEMLKKENK